MPKKQTLALTVAVDADLLTSLGVQFDGKGLALPDNLPINDWLALTQNFIAWYGQATSWANRFKWAISDLLAYGEARYGEKYTQISARLGLSSSTLANWASMARHIPHDERDESVPHSKAYELAFLPPEQRSEAMQLVADAEASETPMTSAEIRVLAQRYRAELDGSNPNIAEARFVLSAAVRDVLQLLEPTDWPAVVHWCLIPMITAEGDFGGDLVGLILGATDNTPGEEVFEDE